MMDQGTDAVEAGRDGIAGNIQNPEARVCGAAIAADAAKQ